MYEINSIEFGQQTQKPHQSQHTKGSATAAATTTKTAYFASAHPNAYSSCSVLTPLPATLSHVSDVDAAVAADNESLESCNPAERTHMTLLSLRRRRLFQRRACLLSILAAFVFGLALGIFVPMFGLANVFATLATPSEASAAAQLQMLPIAAVESLSLISANAADDMAAINRTRTGTGTAHRPPSDFPTIYELRGEVALTQTNSEIGTSSPAAASAAAAGENPFSVAFIKEGRSEDDIGLPAEEVFRNAFHLEQDKSVPDAMIVKKLDSSDGSIKEFRVQRTLEGRFRKGPERRLSQPTLSEQVLQSADTAASAAAADHNNIKFVPMAQRIVENARNQRNHGIIKSDIYWGDLVERALPQGFGVQDAKDWNRYVGTEGVVSRLEPGCGRMQNRLIIFADGRRACARYRQNTDQIQGELFSFYLGQVLNMSNLAPSAAAVIDLESHTWSAALADITAAQWKQQRPVVLTRWLPDLEPAGIPQPFQPLERHLNKYDVWNITLGTAAAAEATTALRTMPTTTMDGAVDASSDETQKGLLKRLGAASSITHNHQSNPASSSSWSSENFANATSNSDGSPSPVLQRLIELAQWSDLIVFDYLIANLDRVVNNLYNFQWNADIMAAPAHNLARQTNSQLLVFLDNESGLLHGYRLLKKYEAYHGLLLDNLCVFRQPTIEALRQLRTYGAGRRLRELFEQTTSAEVRDVLPSLPDKSIKILVDRIDRVLGQVQKCRDLLADR